MGVGLLPRNRRRPLFSLQRYTAHRNMPPLDNATARFILTHDHGMAPLSAQISADGAVHGTVPNGALGNSVPTKPYLFD